LIAGSLNVIINLNSISDRSYVERTKEEMDALLRKGKGLADETLKLVMDKLTR
jgi:formiminotetrahydrofolate cyclodeaminase